MALGGGLSPADYVSLGVAATTLLLALLVLALDFGNRVHRAFALFIFLRAMADATTVLSSRYDDLSGRLHFYALVAIPFAAVHFAYVYRRRFRRTRFGRPQTYRWLTPLLIAVGAFLAEGLYLADHALFRTDFHYGFLSVFLFLPLVAYSGIAFLFARDFVRESARPQRRALLMAAVGVSLFPFFISLFRLVDLPLDLRSGNELFPGWFQTVETAALALTLALTVGVAWVVLRGVWAGPLRLRLALVWSVAAASAVALAVYFSRVEPSAFRNGLLTVTQALWSFCLPLLVTYALLRHQLFDVEVKLRFAIKGTTLGAIAIAVFFAVSELAATFFTDRTGSAVVGILTASLIVFALHPVQRLADRFARRALPDGGALGGLSRAERLRVFREQLEIAWGDGALTAKERILFDRLRERLGLGAEEAMRLESSVLAERNDPAKAPSATGRPAARRS